MLKLGSTLRWLAVAIALAVVAVWAFSGGNAGWTKTSVPIKTVDEVTGIEGIQYQQKFVPGLDFLGLGAVVVAGLLMGSFLARPRLGGRLSTSLHPRKEEYQ
jgi:hypothetical protein